MADDLPIPHGPPIADVKLSICLLERDLTLEQAHGLLVKHSTVDPALCIIRSIDCLSNMDGSYSYTITGRILIRL